VCAQTGLQLHTVPAAGLCLLVLAHGFGIVEWQLLVLQVLQVVPVALQWRPVLDGHCMQQSKLTRV
jgi:hypothetical protein